MSTEVATLPSADAIPSTAPAVTPKPAPEPKAQPAPAAKAEPAKDAPRKSAFEKEPERKPHDWKPKSARERFAVANGEIVVDKDPAIDNSKRETKKVTDDPDYKYTVGADDTDEQLDAQAKEITSGPENKMLDGFRNKAYEIRRLQREKKQIVEQLEAAKTASTEAETLRQRVADMEKAAKEAPVTAALKPEDEQRLKDYEALKQQYEEAQKIISVKAVEHSPEFQKTVGKPLAAIQSDIADIAKTYDPDGKEGLEHALLRALTLPKADRADALEELTSEFKGLDKADVLRAATEYGGLMKRRDEILANADTEFKAMQSQAQQQAEQQQQEAQRAVERYTAEWRKLTPEKWTAVLGELGVGEVEGNDAFNNALRGFGQFAIDNPPERLTTDAKSLAQARAVAFPLAVRKISDLTKENATLKEELAKYESAGARADEGGRQTRQAPTEEEEYKNLTPGQRAAKRAEKAGAFA